MTYSNPWRLWRDVKETLNPRVRLDTVRAVSARVRNELEELTGEERWLSAVHEGLSSHPGHSSSEALKLRGLRFLALLLVILDVPVQLLLNSAAFPAMDAWKVVPGSIGIALGIAAIVHLVLVELLHDPNRPARTIRLCRILASVAFVATGMGATIFLFARQASPEMAGYLVTITAISLWTVAEALPLSAGFFSAWAHVLAEPMRAEKALRRLTVRTRSHRELLQRLEDEKRRLLAEAVSADGAQTPAVESDQLGLFHGRDNTRKGAAALAFALLTLGVGVGPLAAQGTVDGLHNDHLCAVFVDRTMSVDPAHREKALGLLSDGLPVFLEAAGCTEVLAGTFADEGVWAPRRWFRVPAPPDTTSCQLDAAAVPMGAASVLANLRGFQDHFRREAEEACAREESRAFAVFERERQEFLGELRMALSAPQLSTETHTDILGVVESALDADAALTLILTDGIDTVHGEEVDLDAGAGQRVVLMLVPARDEYGGRAATERAAAAWRAAGGEAVPYVGLVAPSSWEWVVGSAG